MPQRQQLNRPNELEMQMTTAKIKCRSFKKLLPTFVRRLKKHATPKHCLLLCADCNYLHLELQLISDIRKSKQNIWKNNMLQVVFLVFLIYYKCCNYTLAHWQQIKARDKLSMYS